MTIGLSRRSSVPALKLKPSRPTRLLPGLDHHVDGVLDLQLVAAEDRLDHRHVEVDFLARYCIARTSFGRQEPPNAKPGFM